MALDGNTLLTQAFSAGGIAWLIQELKKSKWFPGLSMESTSLNKLASAIGALLSGVAIHYTWDQTAGVLTISGLTTLSLVTLLWNATQQFIAQEYVYQVIWHPQKIPEVAVLNAQADILETATDKVVSAIKEKEK